MADSGVIEEVTLNWTDLTGSKTGCDKFGSNKVYKARITESGGTFMITYTYGRVGKSGQTSREGAFTSLDVAKRKMNNKIASKLKKGYTRVEMRSESDEIAKAKAKGVEVDKKDPATKAKKSTRTFHPHVEDLLKIMYGATGKAVRAGLSSSAGASSEAPLGNLSDLQLDKGADILQAIEDLLEKSAAKKKLIELTNDYLSSIPRNIDHARSGGRLDIDAIVLNSKDRVGKERDFIALLRDAHLAKDVFAQAAHSDDPVEVWYDGLKCDIEALEPLSDEFARVRRLFDNGQSPKNSNFFNKLMVRRAWSLVRHGEKDGFDSYSEKVLKKKGATGIVPGWHGTRTENLMGISRSGLLMPENLPRGVRTTGQVFGMGIYHAPCWPDAGQPKKEGSQVFSRFNGALKSMNYTSLGGAYWNSSAAGSHGFLFLEEMALGVPEIHLTACYSKRRPDSGKDYIYAKAFGNPQLAHDEVVTFEEDASRMTHLLEIAHR